MRSDALEACSYLVGSGFCADGLTWVVAASVNNTVFVQALLNHGQRDKYSNQGCEDQSPLVCAITHSNKELITLLLTAGVKANGRGRCVGDPLRTAVAKGDLGIVKYIVDAGADVNANGRPQGAPSPLQQAVGNGRLDIVDYLIRAGANVNGTGRFPSPPLLEAVRTGRLDMVDYLIGAGADVNPEYTSRGYSLLQEAVKGGQTDIVHRLVRGGANVNSPPAEVAGATALQFAAIKGHLGLARYLIDEGAQVNAPPARYRGRTALQGAAEHGRLDMLAFLLTERALTTSRWRRRFIKAVNLAIKKHHLIAADLLKQSAGWSEEDENLLPYVYVDFDTDSEGDELDDMATDDTMDNGDEECGGGFNVVEDGDE
ncbi:ankyrin repeat-containing domain protein [Nemania serpens]|nr:ankyrin repeat-containing domain protein [Nemania serpens]